MDSGPIPVPCDPAQREWLALARAPSLAVLVDLDGTLIPYAPTLDEAVFDDALAHLLRRLHEAEAQVVVISGRPRAAIEPLVSRVPRAWWVAEHGAWRYHDGAWLAPERTVDLDELAQRLTRLAVSVPGARIERKTLSLCLHWRQVAAPARPSLIADAEIAVEECLETHPELERLDGAMTLEIRHRSANKGAAVRWARSRLPADVRAIALGDDITDEDMFAALGRNDAAVAVGEMARQRGRAGWWVAGHEEARGLVSWLSEARLLSSIPGRAPVEAMHGRRAAEAQAIDLLIVSNRTPAAVGTRQPPVSGLVSALQPTMARTRGVWLGWSGHEREPGLELTLDGDEGGSRAVFDYPEGWRAKFYDGFCNQSLWPLLHCFPGRVRYRDDEWTAYVTANAAYAQLAAGLVSRDTRVWIHDYQLMLVGAALRQLGHRGPIGFFLHVPFPPRDLWETLPWSAEVMDAMLAFDLVGFHTRRWAENFTSAAVAGTPGCRFVDGHLVRGDRRTRVEVVPIGVDNAFFSGPAAGGDDDDEVESLRATLGDRKLLLGVDRLDYSKGIPERLEGFRRLLQLHPRWRRKVSFVQVSVPSRADVPEYAELRRRVEELVGRINGELGEADWVPVRYLYRSYEPSTLARLYRLADVAVVTPLRDGMNLVAKEFVAAQDPSRPGALVLSKFAGAAEELDAAILTNPFHADGLAADLDRALGLSLDERIARYERMVAATRRVTATSWADAFLAHLDATRAVGEPVALQVVP